MINILIAGDYSPKNRVASLIENGKYDDVFNEVLPYTKDADFSVINFETTLADDSCKPIDKRGPNLKCTEKALDALTYAGFDCVTLANNHFRDYGDEGCELSFNALKNKGISYVGAGMNLNEAQRILYKEIKGCRLAFCNFCEHEFTVADDTHAGCNPIDLISNYNQIKEARRNADYVIVITHGGHEHFRYPSLRMKKMSHFFIDVGADAVINHHQHCISGFETYLDKPIYYGLGNFCFDWHPSDSWTTGAFVVLKFEESKISSEMVLYSQGRNNPGISILKGENQKAKKEEIELINRIIADDKMLEEVCNEYYDQTEDAYLFAIEPFYNRYLRSLYIRGLYPSSLSLKRLIDLQLFFNCESHFEHVVRIIKKRLI